MRGLNKSREDSELISLGEIADASSMPDALWAIQSLEQQHSECRRLAFASYSLISTNCSYVVRKILQNAEQQFNDNESANFNELYESAVRFSTVAEDSIAATVLHPDAHWAARHTAAAVLSHSKSAEQLSTNLLLIRGLL